MSPEVIAAIGSASIALCALIFSIWQAKVARDHNKISVRPHLTTWTNKDHDNGAFSVYVLNNGIGPALIKKYEIRVDGKIMSGDGTAPMENALKHLFSGQPYQSHNAYMAPGFSLGAKESCRVTSFQFLQGFNLNSEQVDHAFNRADLIIEYESFYGEKFILDSSDERLNK